MFLRSVIIFFALTSTSCNSIAAIFASPTPTPTLTPTPTQTPTSTPTHTPTVTPTPTPSFANVVITLEDLPLGYEVQDPAEFGFEEGTYSDFGYFVEHSFAFIEPSTLQIVFGFTTIFESEFDEAEFDAVLSDPEVMTEALDIVEGFAGELGLTFSELPEAFGIADSSGGFSMVFGEAPFQFHMDLIMFRSGNLGVFLIEMFSEGDEPSVKAFDLANLLVERASTSAE